MKIQWNGKIHKKTRTQRYQFLLDFWNLGSRQNGSFTFLFSFFNQVSFCIRDFIHDIYCASAQIIHFNSRARSFCAQLYSTYYTLCVAKRRDVFLKTKYLIKCYGSFVPRIHMAVTIETMLGWTAFLHLKVSKCIYAFI